MQGCLPMNFFGNTAASAGALTTRSATYGSNKIKQDVLAGTISGELWKGWGAGGLMGAFGLEGRTEELVKNAGDLPFAQRTDFRLQYGDAFAGNTDVKEAFAELETPLLRDLPGAQLLQVNFAGRQAEYTNKDELSAQGSTRRSDTWKFAAVWDPIDWLRFRGSQSHDLRAASFRELYYSQSIPSGGFFGDVTNPRSRRTCGSFGDPAADPVG